MRSKWMRYSSSSASRSPCWARSTRARTRFVSLSLRCVDASCIPAFRAPGSGPANPPPSGDRAEAHAALAREPLHVDDPAQLDRVVAVVGLEGVRRVPVAAQRTL